MSRILGLAAVERCSCESEELLPFEVKQLFVEMRRFGSNMPALFVQHLRTTVRSIAE